MSDQRVLVESDPDNRALARCMDAFSVVLSERGYSGAVIRQKGATVAQFAFWLGRRGAILREVDEADVEAFLAHVRRRVTPIGNRRCTLNAFLEHLRQDGATARPEPVDEEAGEGALLLRRYEVYLREEQGLTAETTDNYLRFVRPLAQEHCLSAGSDAAVTALQVQRVRDFLLRSTRGLRPTTAQLRATALRSFLRFLFLRGETAVDLSVAIPAVRRWRKATVHPYLRPEEVEQLLGACDCTTGNGRRDHAVLLLLARLGMRACEVAALQLKDLRWRSGEILVRGKGRLQQRLPLLPEIGAAIAAYLQHDRLEGPCRNVFLRNEAPRVQLGADAIGLIVSRALHRSGLRPPQRGSHLLRFSLATNMIRRGATMTEIGQVLRHRLPETTEIYAKVDFDALRTVALPWPTEGGVR